jgi:5-methylcytosine-specific restriction endonuclease McrA
MKPQGLCGGAWGDDLRTYLKSAVLFVKFCKKCQADTERNASGKCKPCVRARNAARYAADPEKARAASAAYRTANPGKNRANCAAYYAANQEKVLATAAAWRAANPEKRRIYVHNYRARKLENGGKLSPGISAKLFKLQRGKCACGCGRPLGDGFHLDHIIPLALGGTNADDNIQLLRATCNHQKSSKHPIDFMQQRGFLL